MIRNTQLNVMKTSGPHPGPADTGVSMNKGTTTCHQGLPLSMWSGGWDARDVLC